jgi:DNA invertase Pin-like site-specific DNA recombinase
VQRADAVGYARLSQESDTSIASQIEDIKKYCSAHGFNLLRVFNEGEKASGWDTERSEFNRMIEFVRNCGTVKVIVVRDGSRLGRVFKDRMYWLLYFDRMGVEVHTVEGKIDPDNPTELLVESVKAYSDDVVKRAEIERSRRELKKRIERGLPVGRPPYGFRYSKDKTKLVPEPEEFEKALRVIKLREQGKSWRDISSEVNIATTTARRVWERRDRYKEVLIKSP